MYRKQVRRRRAVLALLVVSSFALLTATYGDRSGTLQRGVGAVFAPLEEGADRALKPARDLVNWVDETFEARGENERLRSQLADAREADVRGENAVQENRSLKKLLGLQRSAPGGYEAVTAQLIARSTAPWASTVTIDKGTSAGVRVDDPVRNEDGLVGRIASASRGQAQVTLITDQRSAVSAKVVPAGVQGVIKPEVGDPGRLVLEFIESSRRIRPSQSVVTAGWRARGLSSLFPGGIPIGEVTRASLSEQEASQRVHVRPFADMRELEFLQVLTRPRGGGG